MRQTQKDYPQHIADIQAEFAPRNEPGMTDGDIMHQVGLSMRVVHDRLPAEEQTPANKLILQDCATEVIEQIMGLDRAIAVVRDIKNGRAKILNALQATGSIH